MLLLIEHDSVMASAAARRCLADFVAHKPTLNVAVFHSEKLTADDVRAAYPPALRERLMLTPDTPRKRDLQFWIAYEAGCVWAALRHNGQLAQCEALVCLVPPAWEETARDQFGAKRVVVMPSTFGSEDARRLARTL